MERALTTLKDLVASQPDFADAHFNLGVLYARQDQAKDEAAAVTEFHQALQLDESLDTARIALGHVLISLQKYSDAIPVALEYTHRQPKDAQGFYAWDWHTRGSRNRTHQSMHCSALPLWIRRMPPFASILEWSWPAPEKPTQPSSSWKRPSASIHPIPRLTRNSRCCWRKRATKNALVAKGPSWLL